VSRAPILEGHAAPFDYIVHTFFEGLWSGTAPQAGAAVAPGVVESTATMSGGVPPTDCVLWANRGGGKTFLGALATVLDLIFKPGIEVRILGGSLEQSQRMHTHLCRFLEVAPKGAAMVKGRITARRIALSNGSTLELLAQSQTSVRGTRVQKIRCDEVDLFDPRVWEAAQLATRSKQCGAVAVRAAVECLSTMHIPHGVMYRIVQEAQRGGRALFRWGVVDVLEQCASVRPCGIEDQEDGQPADATIPAAVPPDAPDDPDACVLAEDCRGRAKEHNGLRAGHIGIDDGVRMKGRVSMAVWKAEMMSLHPRRTNAVVPEFDPRVHVVCSREGWAWSEPGPAGSPVGAGGAQSLTWLAGMDFGIRAPTVVLWGALDERGILWIVDERVVEGAVIDDHVAAIKRGLVREGSGRGGNRRGTSTGWPAAQWIGVDPAGHARSDQTGVSPIHVMRRSGLHVRAARIPVLEGLGLIRARLAPAAGGGPRLFVHERCERLIESLVRFHYPADRPESHEPVKDGFDHAVDALRYLIQNLDKPGTTSFAQYALT